MNLPDAPLSAKVCVTLPPSQQVTINHNSPVRSHPLSIAAILEDAEKKVQPGPLPVATESVWLQNFIKVNNLGSVEEINKTFANVQSEHFKEAKPENTEVINGSDQIIQNFLSVAIQNVSIWTPDAVTLVKGKVYENQWKRMKQNAQLMVKKIMRQESQSTRSFNQYQTETGFNPNATSICHQVPENQKPKDKKAPKRCLADEVEHHDFQTYPKRFPGNDAAPDLPLLRGCVIQCKNLIEVVKYELSTRGISEDHFAEKVLGRTKEDLWRIFNSQREWKDLLNYREKQPYWNLLQWVNASESDKAALLNGRAPSNPNLQLFDIPDEVKPQGPAYQRRFPGDKTALDLQLIEGDIIDCEHLRKRVKYELETRGISQGLFSEKIFGRTRMALWNLLHSKKEWKDLKNDLAKQPYWNVLQWINASDFDKAAVLNGEAPSDPNLKIIVTPYKETVFSAERRREIEKMCREGQFPTLKERREIAAKWNIDETVIGNFAVRIRKQQNEK